ncbi:MAG: hypothetical protein ACREJG_08760 [Candidatus Rokuibacteriota bacterium]
MNPSRPGTHWEYFVTDEGGICAICDGLLRPGAGAVRSGRRLVHALCWLTEHDESRPPVRRTTPR